MPIDTGMYNALMQPRSSLDYAAQYDAQDLAQQRRQLNALAIAQGRDQMTEQTRSLQEADTLRNALSVLGPNATDEQRINAMQGTGLASGYTQADALRQSLVKREQGTATAGKDRADILTKLLTAQGDLAGRVMANPSRESAAAAVANMKMLSQQLGVQMDFSADDAALQQLQTPEDFRRWAAGHALKASELLPKVSTVNTGGAQVTQAIDPLTGRPTETGRIANTQSPDSLASNAVTMRGQNMVDVRARQGLVQADAHFKATQGGAAPKPLPPSALKMQQSGLDAIGVVGSVNADLGALEKHIEAGKLKFGPVSNLTNAGLNMAGMSTEESRNFSSFKATLERLRNESLRLNTGVQTDGDAQRAWNELFQSINDTDLVKQRLAEIKAINKRGGELQQMKVDSVRANYGHPPLDASGYASQPAALNSGGASGGWKVEKQ